MKTWIIQIEEKWNRRDKKTYLQDLTNSSDRKDTMNRFVQWHTTKKKEALKFWDEDEARAMALFIEYTGCKTIVI